MVKDCKKQTRFLFINNVLGYYVISDNNMISNYKLYCDNLFNLLNYHILNIQKFETNKKKLLNFVDFKINLMKIKYNKYNFILRSFEIIKLLLKNPFELVIFY